MKIIKFKINVISLADRIYQSNCNSRQHEKSIQLAYSCKMVTNPRMAIRYRTLLSITPQDPVITSNILMNLLHSSILNVSHV